MEKEKCVNEIEAAGRVVATYTTGAGEMGFTMCIKQGDRTAFPRFSCEKRLMDGIKEHARIRLKGHIEEFLKNINGSYYRERVFVADMVTPEKTLCSEKFDAKGVFFPDHFMTLYLSGIVSEARMDRNDRGIWLRYKVGIGEGKEYLTVPMSLYIRKGSTVPKVYEGDFAGFVCAVSTPEKPGRDGQKVRYTDIMIRDLCVIDSTDRKKDYIDGMPKDAKPAPREKVKPAPDAKKESITVVVRKENLDRQAGDKEAKDDMDVKDIMDDLPDWIKE